VRLLCLCAVSLALAACRSAPALIAASGDAPVQESVSFPGPGVTLAGQLFLPERAERAGSTRPAIVLLHGCGGMYTSRGRLQARHRDWAERFAGWGYVALLVDSFGPRGHGSICELQDRPVHPWVERSADAYAALDFLAARGDVDPTRIFVMGWSNGGSTVVGVVRDNAPGLRPGAARFRAAIAYYPGCQRPLRMRDYRPVVPLLIQHGEADDWVPSAPCVALGEKMRQQGYPVQTITYPGAHHGFDSPSSELRLRPDVWNPSAAGKRGAHVGTHQASRLKAIEDTKAFLDRQLGR